MASPSHISAHHTRNQLQRPSLPNRSNTLGCIDDSIHQRVTARDLIKLHVYFEHLIPDTCEIMCTQNRVNLTRVQLKCALPAHMQSDV